jgi:hypothetical protein
MQNVLGCLVLSINLDLIAIGFLGLFNDLLRLDRLGLSLNVGHDSCNDEK